MKNNTYKFTHFAAYTTLIHGAVYGIYKYFFIVETEYGPRPHSMQGFWQGTHILGSVLLVFTFGVLWKTHILKMLHNSFVKRRSGILLVLTLSITILSGYLVQVIYQNSFKELIAFLHIGVGIIFGLGYIYHHLEK